MDSMMDGMGGASTDGPLNASGIDFTNATQAATFLGEILDDSVFQVEANMYARHFWYGVCVVIGIFTFFNVVQKATEQMRYIFQPNNLLFKLTT
jgi:ferric-chelate reductase